MHPHSEFYSLFDLYISAAEPIFLDRDLCKLIGLTVLCRLICTLTCLGSKKWNQSTFLGRRVEHKLQICQIEGGECNSCSGPKYHSDSRKNASEGVLN